MMDPSKLADRRGAPLAEMPILSMVTLDEVLGFAIPNGQPAAPVAAFNSAI